MCEVLRAVFSCQWVLQSFAMPGCTRWPKGEPDTEHCWTHYEPELSIMSFSQLLNTSSCPSENSEVGEEGCQNSDWLHISILVPQASFNHCCTYTQCQKHANLTNNKQCGPYKTFHASRNTRMNYAMVGGCLLD